MYWPSDRLGRRLGVACFVAVVLLVGLIVALDLPQWVWLFASTLAALGAALHAKKGVYGRRERDREWPSTRP